ncbi:caspase-6-like isoform X2 [Colossoma macropomum]|uniref:caspase-6-like isoform X2 n=1 Tax=Colossoma macropomum TaxID=42526 RepID=UPI0018643B15|nr:caspase-6-like isoform X2 [Colossoma macropomum]
MASEEKAGDLPLEYEMDNKQRGLALIFNQEHFDWKLKLKQRRGTATDKANLTERFQELGFKVKAYDDIKKKKMLRIIRKAAEADHTDADCFVCVFLSHGEDGHVFAHDKKVDIKKITALFRGDRCRSLVGKPKIFIFQACRGTVHENAVTPMGGDSEMSSEVVEKAAILCTLPAGADFLMCYCVSEGFVSFRNIYTGSFYIQDLCETLQEHGSTLEFTELLTLINLKVSRRCAANDKQMPCFTSMLTKKLYFRPKKECNTTWSSTTWSNNSFCLLPKRCWNQ